MNKQIVKVPFGKEGWTECKKRSVVNGEIDGNKLYGEMFGYLIDGLMEQLKEMGYKRIGRGRILFEEAADWQARFAIERISKVLKISGYTKMVKYIEFNIGEEIPKVE